MNELYFKRTSATSGTVPDYWKILDDGVGPQKGWWNVHALDDHTFEPIEGYENAFKTSVIKQLLKEKVITIDHLKFELLRKRDLPNFRFEIWPE